MLPTFAFQVRDDLFR